MVGVSRGRPRRRGLPLGRWAAEVPQNGLAAARSPKATYFEDSLADSLAAMADKHAAEIVSDMRKLVLDFSAGMLVDDLTMVVLRVGRPPGR